MASLTAYALAIRQAQGPARRLARVVPRLADIGKPGGGLVIEVDEKAIPSAAAADLSRLAPYVLETGCVTGRWASARAEVGCGRGAAFGMCLFASVYIESWGLPRMDIVVGD